MNLATQSKGKKGKRGDGDDENLTQAVEVSSKTALELNHGMMVEFLKKFMFTGEQAPAN